MTALTVLALLLLPIAAASGWYVARRGSERSSGIRVSALSADYFRGLNYLLNEQQDKAIEVFLQLAEVNRDTVETHLALGNLFRRRGEVDRAIRVHQNLIARTSLSDDQKTVALLELGEDYMRAGLLDRAETLFSDLVAMNTHLPSALRHLLAIYQQERDWAKAIEHARRLQSETGESVDSIVAQFCCELAEQARAGGDLETARRYLAQAFDSEPHCIRAGMIEGRLEADAGNYEAAVQAFEDVTSRDVEFVPEILSPLLNCYARLQRMERAEQFLSEIIERYHGVSPVLALARIYQSNRGEREAIEFLTRQLRLRPSVRGLMGLIDMSLATASDVSRENLLILKDLTRQLLEGKAVYRCGRCGFGARSHHWQCPSCKGWSTVKPIHGVAGE